MEQKWNSKRRKKRAHPPLIPKLVLNQIACVEYCSSEQWDTHLFTGFEFLVKSQKYYSCFKMHLPGPWLRKVSNQLQLKKKKSLEKTKGKP